MIGLQHAEEITMIC